MHTGRLPRSWPLNTNEEIQQTHSTENILPHGYWRISMLWHPSEASHLLHVKQESDFAFTKTDTFRCSECDSPKTFVEKIPYGAAWDLQTGTMLMWTLEGLCLFFSGWKSIWVYHKPVILSKNLTNVPWLVSLQLEDLFQDLFRR